MPRVVVPLVREAYRDAVPGARPQFLDEPVVQFLDPLASEERQDFVSSVDELRAVPPSCIDRVCQSYVPGSRVFQPSSARRTLCIALSRVNGGKGGRVALGAVAMLASP